MMEAAVKLEIKSQTIASASIYFHRFYSNDSREDREIEQGCDPMLLAATCISLAAKVEEDQVKVRDIINVFHRSVHPDQPPLDIGPVYWSLRDSISHLEMILLRFLQFKVTVDHPHRYMLHYLDSLNSWLHCDRQDKFLLARIAWSILSDFNLNPKCILHDPSAVAISVLSLALKMAHLSVPYERDGEISWHEAVNEKVSSENVNEIIGDLVSFYEQGSYS